MRAALPGNDWRTIAGGEGGAAAHTGAGPSDPWPEDAPPADLPVEAFAALAGHGSRVVWGEGDPRAPLLVVLDNPGAREDTAGRPYTCGTRLTLRAAAAEAGLRPERDLYVTYLLKRRPRRAYDREAAWAAYLPLLRRQIGAVGPRALVCAGDTVVHAVLAPGADVKGLRGRVLCVEGRPAVVTYHPLAARRRPALYPLLVADLVAARRLL